MVMKGDFDFEAEEDGLSFGLGNDEEDDEDEVAGSWQDGSTAIGITSVNITVLIVLTSMDFILKVAVQQWLRQEKNGMF
jgi:hypothetical protein